MDNSPFKKPLKLLAPFAIAASAPLLLAVSPGSPAPDFTARNQNGKPVHLADYHGKFVLLYFYPKDDTPGCTQEACSFRDHYAEIQRMNTVIFGISRQDERSHQKFIARHSLPFDLLVDSDGSIGAAYGVKTMPIIGFLKRRSVLIGPDGKVVRFYEDVNPASHASEVIADIRKATAHGSPPRSESLSK